MLTKEQINSMTIDQAVARGMGNWNRKLYLIHESDYNNWPDGVELTSILGEKVIKGKDRIDMDTRGGYLAYGIYPKS